MQKTIMKYRRGKSRDRKGL